MYLSSMTLTNLFYYHLEMIAEAGILTLSGNAFSFLCSNEELSATTKIHLSLWQAERIVEVPKHRFIHVVLSLIDYLISIRQNPRNGLCDFM